MLDTTRFKTSAQDKKDELVAIRRHLHAHPELSYHEEETAIYISKKLDEMGISHVGKIGGNGIVASIGKPGGKVVALRGDMDALPILEENDVPYASKNKGVMHACGHDVHTTCLLGAASVLKSMESDLNGLVQLIFQPAEEKIPGGASLMIKEGVLKNPDIQMIFGQHVFPDMEVGHVGFKGGMYMASTDELYFTVKGKGGHAALPHTCIDPVLISSHLIVALQQMVSRRARADMPTVLSIGKVEAKGATNIIPDKVYMEGTMRTMNEDWRSKMHSEIEVLAKNLCKSMGAEVDVEIRKGYPSLVNNPELTNWAKSKAIEVLGEEKVHDLPIRMTAEDFAFVSQHCPVCFYRLGVANKEKWIVHSVHHPNFDIDSSALKTGMESMAYLAMQLVNQLD
jgi:amidohydrolase